MEHITNMEKKLAVGFEAVDQLVNNVHRVCFIPHRSDHAIDLKSELGGFDVAFGDVGFYAYIDKTLHVLRDGRLSLCVSHGGTEHLHIHVIADAFHLSRLVRTEQIARAANLKIAHGNLDAGAEFSKFANRLQSLAGGLGERFEGRYCQIGVCPAGASSHAPSDLVQLRKTEITRVFDNQRVAVGNVDSGFDDIKVKNLVWELSRLADEVFLRII